MRVINIEISVCLIADQYDRFLSILSYIHLRNGFALSILDSDFADKKRNRRNEV